MIKISEPGYFAKLSNSIDTLSSNIENGFNGLKNIADFIGKVGKFLGDIGEIFTNPSGFINSIQPYIIIAMMVMIVLRLIGFKPEKWFRLCFIILIISFFC